MLVVGGGVAGVAAAVTACRQGLKTVLIEREQTLGGTAVHGLTGTVCGLYRNGGSEPGAPLQGGLVAEIVEGLRSLNPQRSPRKAGRVFVLPYESHDLQEVLAGLCRNEDRLTLLLGSSPVSIAVDNGVVTSVTVSSGGRRTEFAPSALVDASGNGDAAVLAGAEFELAPAEQLQLAGFTARIAGLDSGDDSLPLKVPFVVAKGVEAGSIPDALRYTVLSAGERPGEGLLKINIPDGFDGAGIEDDVAALVAWLAGVLPAFRNARIIATSERKFSREGRRILGVYQLTADDVLSARKFGGSPVRGAWPVEIWGRERGVSYRYPPDGDYYEIPAGCIRAKGFKNLFTAGRCISVTHEALGSTRVIATCIALGEMAGLAAADYVSSSDSL